MERDREGRGIRELFLLLRPEAFLQHVGCGMVGADQEMFSRRRHGEDARQWRVANDLAFCELSRVYAMRRGLLHMNFIREFANHHPVALLLAAFLIYSLILLAERRPEEPEGHGHDGLPVDWPRKDRGC